MSHYPLTLLYDGACPLCVLEMSRLMARNERGLLKFIDATDHDFDATAYGVTRAALMKELHAVTPDGNLVRGIAAIRLAYAGAGLKTVALLLGLPGVMRLATWAYPLIADNRYVLSRRLQWLIAALQKREPCSEAGCEAYAHPHYEK